MADPYLETKFTCCSTFERDSFSYKINVADKDPIYQIIVSRINKSHGTRSETITSVHYMSQERTLDYLQRMQFKQDDAMRVMGLYVLPLYNLGGSLNSHSQSITTQNPLLFDKPKSSL